MSEGGEKGAAARTSLLNTEIFLCAPLLHQSEKKEGREAGA